MVIFRIGRRHRVPDEAKAFSHRDARYLFHPIVAWAKFVDDSRMIEANGAFATAMRPFTMGASYLNFTHKPTAYATLQRRQVRPRVSLKDLLRTLAPRPP